MRSSEQTNVDTSLPPIVIAVCVGLFVVIFVSLGSALGLWTLAATIVSGGPDPSPGLDDYDAVESIKLENETLLVRTGENPQFTAIGSGDREVDFLKVVAEDGTVDQRTAINDGQRVYRFGLPDDPSGNYTLTLIHHQPADPGLFGSPEKEYEQHVRFTINESAVTVTEVPHEAGYE